MGSIDKALIEHRDVFRRYKVNRLGVFGSYARGTATPESDIDLLVDFSEDIDLFTYSHLVEELTELLGHRVDVATPDALKPYIRDKVLREVRWIEGF